MNMSSNAELVKKQLSEIFENFGICNMDKISSLCDVSGKYETAVMKFLLDNMQKGNRCYKQNRHIVQHTGMTTSNASRTIAKLVDKRLIKKYDQSFMINPYFVWKGFFHGRKKACAIWYGLEPVTGSQE